MGNIGGEIEEIEKRVLSSSSSAISKRTMPILSLNHVSFVCKSVADSVRFYEHVLGFVLIKRPSSFDFQGAWLFNYGIGIHLLESEKAPKKGKINPKDNHISFNCSDMEVVVRKLEEHKIEYVTAEVEEGGITVDQLFFHDPDGYMVEICNCQNLPVLPISSSCPPKLPTSPPTLLKLPSQPSCGEMRSWEEACSRGEASLMMDNLLVGIMDISI